MIFVFIDTLSLLVVKAAGIWKMPATKEIRRILKHVYRSLGDYSTV